MEYSDDQYTVVVPVSFEKNKANFTYVFDKSGTPTSLTVDVNYTLAQNMEKAAMNTVMGLGTVFVILVFLIFVISLFKYIPGLVEGKKKRVHRLRQPQHRLRLQHQLLSLLLRM